jgi:hypothetical protein
MDSNLRVLQSTAHERNALAEAYMEQQHKLTTMKSLVKLESDKLRNLEQSLKQVLQRMPTHKIPIQKSSTINDENGTQVQVKIPMTLLLKMQNKPEYLSKKSLNTLLLKFFKEKFGSSQTEKAINEISQEASNFIWTSRKSSEKLCIHLSAPRKKRKRSANNVVELNV